MCYHKVISLEVKAEINIKEKSLKTYREKYSPELSVRSSMADYKKNDGLEDNTVVCNMVHTKGLK